MVPFAVAGLVAWAFAGLVMLLFRDRLSDAGHGSWLGICLAGFLFGILGLLVMLRHDANRRQRYRDAGPAGSAPEGHS